jgi:hypothetical protein
MHGMHLIQIYGCQFVPKIEEPANTLVVPEPQKFGEPVPWSLRPCDGANLARLTNNEVIAPCPFRVIEGHSVLPTDANECGC